MARFFFVLSALAGFAAFAVGLTPVETTVNPAAFGVEAWVLAANGDTPLRYDCGSALSQLDYTDPAALAGRSDLDRFAADELMAGCSHALASWTLGTVLLLAASSLLLGLMVITFGLQMLMGTARVVGRLTGTDTRPTRRPAMH